MSDKIYLGSAKKKGKNWYNGTINMDKIEPHIKEFKGHRIVKVDINIFEEPDQYGKSLKITLDTWKPEEQKQTPPDPEYYTPAGGDVDDTFVVEDNSIPF